MNPDRGDSLIVYLPAFYDSPAISRLADLCGESRLMTESRLLRVWALANSMRTFLVTGRDVDRAARWTGSMGFVRLMHAAGMVARYGSECDDLWNVDFSKYCRSGELKDCGYSVYLLEALRPAETRVPDSLARLDRAAKRAEAKRRNAAHGTRQP